MIKKFCLGAIALSGLLVSCSGQTRSIPGSLTIASNGALKPIDRLLMDGKIGEKCSSGDVSSGYSDIDTGGQVTVKDASDKLIAKGILGEGKVVNVNGVGGCEFTFEVPNVPQAEFYTISMGSRKGITYSAKEMEEQKWRVDLKL